MLSLSSARQSPHKKFVYISETCSNGADLPYTAKRSVYQYQQIFKNTLRELIPPQSLIFFLQLPYIVPSLHHKHPFQMFLQIFYLFLVPMAELVDYD